MQVLLAAGAAVLIALVGGIFLGRGMGTGLERIDNPVDVGFARDMIVHHAQAVQMSEIVHRRSPDRNVNFLAFDIMTTQQGQVGIMSGWLDLWRHDQGGGTTMAWMGKPHEGLMPGMSTRAEVEQLNALPIPAMHEQFLRRMIRHHRGALPMASYAAKHASSPDLRRLAGNMVTGQQAEIDLMQSMLADRSLPAEPDALPHSGSAPGSHPGSHS